MRILFGITGQLSYGGLVQQSVVLVKYLREFGCQVLPAVALAPPRNDEVDLDDLEYIFGAFNIADYVLRDKPALLRWLLGWYARYQVANGNPHKLKSSPAAARSMREVDVKKVIENLVYRPDEGDLEKVNRLRRRFNPDIEYACELSMAGYFGVLADLGVPLVSAAQGYELCQRYGVDIIPAIETNAPRIDALISGSHANLKENIARDLPFLAPKTRVIHYGVVNDQTFDMSMQEARRRAASFAPLTDDFTMISLGRVEVEKGVDLALHVVRILLNSGYRVRLRIVGDSLLGEHYRRVIDNKIGMMDLQPYVDFVGFVESKADKVALLKTSNVLLATFIKSEPFGLVICEAMAAGIPVIAPDTGAGAEILGWNGYQSGMVYRTQDTGDIADRVAYLIDNPAAAEEMGRNGRRAVAEHFNAERMSSDILHLFEELVNRPPVHAGVGPPKAAS
ncbi:MAG: glycosyltransferase family 4 protein [Bacteroidetes bacterium]|nr:glycosyltransferase family 4 protein [Bacteroidota bacterium]MCL5025798.1 glycosyltransferase family 4 protein [Chloroflexota bacterium]